MSKQPNALRLADLLDKIPSYGHTPTDTAAAAELRRQHALLEEMAGASRGLLDALPSATTHPAIVAMRAVLAKWEASK